MLTTTGPGVLLRTVLVPHEQKAPDVGEAMSGFVAAASNRRLEGR